VRPRGELSQKLDCSEREALPRVTPQRAEPAQIASGRPSQGGPILAILRSVYDVLEFYIVCITCWSSAVSFYDVFLTVFFTNSSCYSKLVSEVTEIR
jgi:hypothetical protein